MPRHNEEATRVHSHLPVAAHAQCEVHLKVRLAASVRGYATSYTYVPIAKSLGRAKGERLRVSVPHPGWPFGPGSGWRTCCDSRLLCS